MPEICKQCGKQHATKEELEALVTDNANVVMRKVTKKLRRTGYKADIE